MKKKRNVKVVAENFRDDKFDVYLVISGEREYVITHRRNYFLYELLKRGVDLQELKREKPQDLYSKNDIKITRGSARKAINSLNYLLKVVDCVLYEIEEEKAYA